MSIIVQCPHCEMKFNVQADLVGKPLRCPNMGCRKVFKVQPLTAVEPEPPAGPAPAQPGTTSAAISHSAASSPPQTTTPRSDSLTQEQVKTNKNRSSTTVPRPPTVARSPATGSKPPPLPSSLAHASAATTPDHQEVSEISQRTQADVGKSGEPDQAAPREVEWSAGLEAPEASVSPPDRSIQSETVTVYEQSSANELESLLLPERRRRSWAPLILIGLSISAILLLGFSAFYLLYYQDLAERQLAATAEENYKQGNYAAAAKDYEQLAQGYPNSPEAEKYRFFADLSRLQAAVRVVTNRQDYTAALTQWEEFVGTYRQSPWAKPNSGYGHDILEAGKKLCEDMIYVADEQLQKFRNDRTNQSALEGEVRKAIPKGRELVKTLETFRAADDPPLDKLRQEWERLEEELQREESRRQALAQARQHLQTVTDARIAQAESALAAAGWLQDPEAQALLNEARTRLRALIRYEPDPAAAQTPPVSMTRNIYCIAAMGTTARLAPPGAVEGTSAVFPIVARGILYALDEDSGQLLWAARVGTDITYTPTQARLALPEGVTEGLICPIHAGGQYGLAAYLLRSGELRWYQTLPAPAAAPPVVVGSRAYVAVRDELGTVYEFDVSDGTRRGRIRLGQPLAFLIAAPEGRYLYAAAEARRVFTLDAGSRDEADALLPLQCVQVIHTGHEPGTLRSAPVILDVPALAAAGTERRLLLCQANGARSMKLRLFTLPPLPPGLPADGLPPEIRPNSVDYPLEGWTSFPPRSDGERLVVVTDVARLRVLNINPSGGPDPPLSPLPDRSSLHTPNDPNVFPLPAAVVPAAEGAFLVLMRGTVQKYRLGIHPQRGLEVIAVDTARPLGVPIQEPLLNLRRDAVCLTLRQVDTGACQAVLIQLEDGSIRWRRQLGLVAADPPQRQGEKVLLPGQDGGLFALGAATLANPTATIVAGTDQLLAAVPEQTVGPTMYAISSDRTLLASVTPVEELQRDRRQLRLLIRLVRDGQIVHEGQVPAPASLAGRPLLVGEILLLPLADGVIYRYLPGKGLTVPDNLEPGPLWRQERRETGTTTALLAALDDQSLLSNDGSRLLKRWIWPKGQRWSEGGTWELRERPAIPPLPLVKEGRPPRFLIADVTGNVWLYSADRSEQAIRRWRPGAVLPLGPPTSAMTLTRDPQGNYRVAYTVDHRFVVCLNPDQDVPVWIQRHSEGGSAALVGPPLALPDGDWLTIDLSGRLVRLEGAKGIAQATTAIDLPGVFPLTSPTLISSQEVLVPLSDGSAILLTVPTPAQQPPSP